MGRLIYLLDTNIISEPTKQQPNKNVLKQLEKQNGHYCIAAPVWHELHYGCALLADSKRKTRLKAYLKLLLDNSLDVLPYDARAATWFAAERGRLQLLGLSPNYTDGEIAAIAASQSLIMVTRNTTDFQNFQGLTLQNWFKATI